MFPPNLQKNIRELDRQISLLETECDNMESDKRELPAQGKTSSKKSLKEYPNKTFVTGPLCSFSTRKISTTPVSKRALNTCSAPCMPVKPASVNCWEGKRDESSRRSGLGLQSNQHFEGKGNWGGGFGEARESKPSKAFEVGPDEPKKTTEKPDDTSDNETRISTGKRSISSIREVSEPSEENLPVCTAMNDEKNLPLEHFQGRTWVDVSPNPNWGDQKKRKKAKEITPENLRIPSRRPSSGDESVQDEHKNQDKKSSVKNDHCNFSYEKDSSKKRRPRSVRTRKNYMDDIPVDANIGKAWHEKEIQCMIWNEEREKNEFLSNLNDSIRTLHLLITELKRKSSQEKRSDVLNDMQNTLMKISGIKSMNSLQNPLQDYPYFNVENLKIVEGDDNPMVELKKTLYGVKQFCEELSNEKLALSDEVDAKSRTIATMRNKEKELLTLISHLKFNLEKIREEAEEGGRVKRDLAILQNKLQAETKVIEALKKSHGKMQALVENYVLENDKLRTQLKLAKLESHKLNVLLAGKEMEIKKYKNEIETFQKQVSEQLKMLRSKASENDTIKVLQVGRNATQIFGRADSPSDLTFVKNSYNGDSESSKSSLESMATQDLYIPEIDQGPTTDCRGLGLEEAQRQSANVPDDLGSNPDQNEAERSPKDAGFASCKSDDSDTPRRHQNNIQEALPESKIRNKFEDLYQDIKKNGSEKMWHSSQNSYNTSQCTITSSSGDIMSECSPRY